MPFPQVSSYGGADPDREREGRDKQHTREGESGSISRSSRSSSSTVCHLARHNANSPIAENEKDRQAYGSSSGDTSQHSESRNYSDQNVSVSGSATYINEQGKNDSK